MSRKNGNARRSAKFGGAPSPEPDFAGEKTRTGRHFHKIDAARQLETILLIEEFS